MTASEAPLAGVRVGRLLLGDDRAAAADTIRRNHYTRSVPSGKSHYVQFGDAIVVWSIPANKNIARFVLGWPGNVWELSRLWAPDGHEKNLLTQAISAAVKMIVRLEKPDALVSYADPNAGHKGGVYRAASWIYHGKSEEVRTYLAQDGTTVARRAFHSGRKGLRKAEIEALGYKEAKLPGKERFVRPISKRAARTLTANGQHNRRRKMSEAKNEASALSNLVRFLFRPHREMLADAMSEVQEFASKQELIDFLQSGLDAYGIGKYDCSKLTVEKYGSGIDERIGWDTYIVHLAGYGVFGFTNGPVDTSRPAQLRGETLTETHDAG